MAIHPLIEQDLDYLVTMRRHFHSRPELSMREYNTAARVEAELAAAGIPTRRVGETGVLGILHGKEGPGKKSSFGRTWTPCPFRMKKQCPTPPLPPA